MRFLLVSAAKDLRRRLADPAALLLWMAVPAAVGGLLALISGGGGGGAPRPRVLLVDRDSTFVSGLLVSSAGQERLAHFIELVPIDSAEGRARIDDGDASVLLTLPRGFQDAVLGTGPPVDLELVTNPSQRILPAMAEQGVEMLAEAAFYLQRLFGPEVALIAAGPPAGAGSFADSTVSAMSVRISRRFRALGPLLLPPALTVKGEAGAAAPSSGFNFGALFLPGLVLMAVLLIAQGMSDEVWSEREGGTLRRLATTPRSMAPVMGGKLIAGAVLSATVSVVGLGVTAAFFGVSLVRTPLALFWCTFTGTALLQLFTLVQLFARSRRGGNLLTTMIVFPILMIGGSFFPFEMMPDWMAAIGRWTPNGLALVRLKEMLLGGLDPTALALSALGIALPAAVAFALSLKRLSGRFATG